MHRARDAVGVVSRLYGLGHRPDPPHVTASLRHVSALMADDAKAGIVSPARASSFIRQVHNQRGSSFCVGHALGQGLAIAARSQGLEVPEVSALGILRMSTITPNDGCMPSEACERIMTRGVVADSTWPVEWVDDAGKPDSNGWNPGNSNELLPLDVWEKALDATITEVGTLDLADRESIDAAIDAGYSIAWSMVVDAQVDNFSGGAIGVPNGPSRGRHYTLLVDRDTAPVGVNSWSTSWGIAWAGFSGGFYRASYERLGDSSSTDGRVLRVAPKVIL